MADIKELKVTENLVIKSRQGMWDNGIWDATHVFHMGNSGEQGSHPMARNLAWGGEKFHF